MRALRIVAAAVFAASVFSAAAFADIWGGVSGTWERETAPYVGVSGTYHPWKNAWVGVSGTWQLFYSSLTASTAPTHVSAVGAHGILTTNATTCSPNGGTSPYTYAWTRTSGDTQISATAPTSATTAFTAMTPIGSAYAGTWTCTITDHNGFTAPASVTVSIVATG